MLLNYIELKARAKINIALNILGKLDNGYHQLRMIMQTVNLHDVIFIKKINSPGIVLKTSLPWLPTDGKNIVYNAANRIIEEYELKNGVYIDLRKNIPVAAGLAGGSSDCAAVLLGMKKLFKLDIPTERLMEIGCSLGADVPYCLLRGTALVEGIGERLTPLPPFPSCYILLSKPSVNVSTASVYSAFDKENILQEADIEKLIYYIEKQDLKNICANMGNMLESVTANNYPAINKIKQTMLKNGAVGVLMSGSGPTVFGIFSNKTNGIKAYNKLRYEKNIKETYLTTIFNRIN